VIKLQLKKKTCTIFSGYHKGDLLRLKFNEISDLCEWVNRMIGACRFQVGFVEFAGFSMFGGKLGKTGNQTESK
jgi:hypothetical protein